MLVEADALGELDECFRSPKEKCRCLFLPIYRGRSAFDLDQMLSSAIVQLIKP